MGAQRTVSQLRLDRWESLPGGDERVAAVFVEE